LEKGRMNPLTENDFIGGEEAKATQEN